MPLIGFKKRFAPLVESGKKRQTIRAKRRDGRNPHPGETLYLYTGLRTKGCRKIGEVTCLGVQEITIDPTDINLSGTWLNIAGREAMARADGFKDFAEMRDFFDREHGIPFSGLLIQW